VLSAGIGVEEGVRNNEINNTYSSDRYIPSVRTYLDYESSATGSSKTKVGAPWRVGGTT
jgi:hypothetical protein